MSKSWGVMYSVVTIVINTAHLKVARRVDLKNYHHEENFLTMNGDECY